jgi:hypothetical protein
MTTKSIIFKGTISSNGIVNFDGKDAKWLLKKAKSDFRNQLSHDNVKVAKHAYVCEGTDKDGNPIYKAVLKISKDCLRNGIFKNDQPFHNPGIVHAPKVLINLLASVAGLLRGYMFADDGIKRKSPVYISDAVQVSNNVSTFDIGTQDSPKETKVDAEAEAGLTMHFKESIGGVVSYEFQGSIDISELQFISLSQVYDRLAVDPNYLEVYTQALATTLGSKVSAKAFYIKTTASNGLPEEGLLLTPEQIKKLVVDFFARLLDLEIIRGANGRAWLSSLEIVPKQSGLDFNKNGFVIKTASDVLNAIGEPHMFYTEYNQAEALKLYEDIDVGKKNLAGNKSAVKAAKKEAKEKATQKANMPTE